MAQQRARSRGDGPILNRLAEPIHVCARVHATPCYACHRGGDSSSGRNGRPFVDAVNVKCVTSRGGADPSTQVAKARPALRRLHVSGGPLEWRSQEVRRSVSMVSRRTFALVVVSLLAHPSAAHATGPDAMTIGAADAPLNLIEYASLTCAHCAEFHGANWRVLKSEYIDAGRVRFTLSELATPPANVAVGMFQVARCGDASANEYFRRVAVLYEHQTAILQTASGAGVRCARPAWRRMGTHGSANHGFASPMPKGLSAYDGPCSRRRPTVSPARRRSS